jgi:hypothetical protein
MSHASHRPVAAVHHDDARALRLVDRCGWDARSQDIQLQRLAEGHEVDRLGCPRLQPTQAIADEPDEPHVVPGERGPVP